jgi:putative iron-dependent peroxidase
MIRHDPTARGARDRPAQLPVPYRTVSEAGLFFIAYNNNLSTFEKMLRRMMGTSGDGKHDRLMDYTQAVSGATFFAPSLSVLRSLAR